MSGTLDLSGYVPNDKFFGAPFIDTDEQRNEPVPHRYLHGGFEGTATRFAIYFPAKTQWRKRFFQPVGGGQGGDEFSAAPWVRASEFLGGLREVAELGGFMIESNQGHVQSAPDPNADDPDTLYGYRASAESALFARFAATRYYGEAPRYGYLFGAGAGAGRTMQCMERVPGLWDGAYVYATPGRADPKGGSAVGHNPTIINFSAMLNVRNILGLKLAEFIDAFEPGGSGKPYDGLTEPQRQAVAELYALGFPGGEVHLSMQIGPTAVWATSAEALIAQDPGYFKEFWTTKGYAGADHPDQFRERVISVKTTVDQIVSNDDLRADMAAGGPATSAALAVWWTTIYPGDLVVGLVPKETIANDLIGARVTITSGAAAGRRLYCRDMSGRALLVDANGEAGLIRLKGVRPGDSVEIDNRDFLAFCHWYRHHIIPGDQVFDRFAKDGRPIYPQRLPVQVAGNGGVPLTGRFAGRILSSQHIPDTMIWPIQPASYAKVVRAAGEEAASRFCLRWIENAENSPPWFFPKVHPAMNTRIIDFSGVIRQNLHDLVAWVEDGAAPAATNFHVDGSQVRLPERAAARGGIQPIVRAAANGATRAEVRVGEAIRLDVCAEMPAGAGRVVNVEWDFEGFGTFPFTHDLADGWLTSVTLTTTHTFSRPGTYFPAVRVRSQRDGNMQDRSRWIENLGRVRVVVT